MKTNDEKNSLDGQKLTKVDRTKNGAIDCYVALHNSASFAVLRPADCLTCCSVTIADRGSLEYSPC